MGLVVVNESDAFGDSDFERADTVLRSAFEQAAEHASGGIRAMLCTNRGLILRRRGRLEEATRLHQPGFGRCRRPKDER